MSEEIEMARQLVVRIGREQKLSYNITPSPDALLPADSLGGQLVALSDLFSALGQKDGINLKTMVANISMLEDGAIKFDLVIAPVAIDPALRPADKEKGE